MVAVTEKLVTEVPIELIETRSRVNPMTGIAAAHLASDHLSHRGVALGHVQGNLLPSTQPTLLLLTILLGSSQLSHVLLLSREVYS